MTLGMKAALIAGASLFILIQLGSFTGFYSPFNALFAPVNAVLQNANR